MRRCHNCGALKPESEFPKDPTHNRCRSCKSAQAKISYRRNPQTAKDRARRWAARNHDHALALRRAAAKRRFARVRDARNRRQPERYRANLEANRKYARDLARAKRAADPSLGKRRYAANREKLLAAAKAWAKAHPDVSRQAYHRNLERSRAKGRQHAAIRRARKRGVRVRPADLVRIMVRDKMRCHICKKRVAKRDLHFDHVIPLSKGGAHEEVNLAVSHKHCNLTKAAKVTKLF